MSWKAPAGPFPRSVRPRRDRPMRRTRLGGSGRPASDQGHALYKAARGIAQALIGPRSPPYPGHGTMYPHARAQACPCMMGGPTPAHGTRCEHLSYSAAGTQRWTACSCTSACGQFRTVDLRPRAPILVLGRISPNHMLHKCIYACCMYTRACLNIAKFSGVHIQGARSHPAPVLAAALHVTRTGLWPPRCTRINQTSATASVELTLRRDAPRQGRCPRPGSVPSMPTGGARWWGRGRAPSAAPQPSGPRGSAPQSGGSLVA